MQQPIPQHDDTAPHHWEYDLWEPTRESLTALLERSLEAARRGHLPRDLPAPQPKPTPINEPKQPQQQTTAAAATVAESTLAQLIGGCGVAAIDGYLTMREYAAARGLDLAEIHHKGIDLQDLVSTLVIHTQKMAEMEGRAGSQQRYKR